MLNAHKRSNNSKPTIHIAVSSATGNRMVTSPREQTSLSQIKIRLETRIIFSPLTLLHPRACVRSAINPSTKRHFRSFLTHVLLTTTPTAITVLAPGHWFRGQLLVPKPPAEREKNKGKERERQGKKQKSPDIFVRRNIILNLITCFLFYHECI